MPAPRRFALTLVLLAMACTPAPAPAPPVTTKLPEALPFAFTRPDAGTAPTPAEVTAFTRKVTGFWKDVDYFRWATRLAHGLDASFDAKMPGYALWWGQVQAIKAGDTVTFRHGDWDDNLTIEMSKLMVAVSAGYLATGDASMHRLVVEFSKGYSAFVLGMRWGNEPADEFLWARAVYNHDHAYTIDGRKVAVDYSPIRHTSIDWNAHTVANETNPTWGSIWLRNVRSKDDIPQILRVAPWLMRLVQDAPDADVKTAAGEALSLMRGFAHDTVSHAYVMRSKENGQVFVPEGDLASFTTYDTAIPNGECDGKLAFALVDSGTAAGNDCGDGILTDYENVAGTIHYYNVPMNRFFHLASLTNALVNRQDVLAKELLAGLARRADLMPVDPQRASVPEWDVDRAATLVAAAASGLPLTGDEARLVHAQFGASADFYTPWPYWDLWSATVPDGTYPYVPDHRGPGGQYVSIQEMSSFLEYCASPWRNPATVAFIDCDVVRDPARWGL